MKGMQVNVTNSGMFGNEVLARVKERLLNAGWTVTLLGLTGTRSLLVECDGHELSTLVDMIHNATLEIQHARFSPTVGARVSSSEVSFVVKGK